MKAAVFAYSRQGMRTARRVLDFFARDDAQAFVPERLSAAGFTPLPVPSKEFYGDTFRKADAMIFVSSCGIAVRETAPFIRDKKTDPAVICIDEQGRFVIPILSGHIGGANELAERLAVHLSAISVITTATDINRKFSADAWAARNGFIIDNMHRAKEISAAILEQDIPVLCDLPVLSAYPGGTYPGNTGAAGIYIGWELKSPFAKTLRLIPPFLTLGIGCRKGIGKEAIRSAVDSVLTGSDIDIRAVGSAASIDLKAEEPGLIDFCTERNIPIRFYSAETLSAVQGDFSHSDFVLQTTGVDNICERAAMIGADRLIIPKTAVSGVTVAVGAKVQGVSFE